MEDYERLNELLYEKEQQILHINEEHVKKNSEKEKEIQTLKCDFLRISTIIFDLETRLKTHFQFLMEDNNFPETAVLRINSLEKELSIFFTFCKTIDKHENQYVQGNNKKNEIQIEEYWKSVVIALTSEKEMLLKKIEDANFYEFKELHGKIKKLEDFLQEKNSNNFNENYWKSVILSLSNEKEQLLKKIEENSKCPPSNTECLLIRVNELEQLLLQKHNQIMGFNDIIHQWQMKYSQIEQDIQDTGIEALNKEDRYERELSTLKEQLLANERLLGQREAEILDYCQTLSERTEKQKFLENENLRLMNELNEFRLKFTKIQKEYQECQKMIRNLEDEMNGSKKNKELAIIQEQKLLDLNSKFEEFKAKSFEKIESLVKELELQESLKIENIKKFETKCQENFELSEMTKELELLSDSLSKTLSLKECQIENLEKKCRLFDNERIILEKKNEELLDLKNRNKRCIETISTSSQEINSLKKEIEAMIQHKKSFDNKLFEKEALIIELNHELKVSKSQCEKHGKLIQEKDDIINELKNIQGTHSAEKEINIKEINQQINFLKKELEQKNIQIANLKAEKDKVSNEYQKLIEQSEKMLMESDNKCLTIDMLNKTRIQEDFEPQRVACSDMTNINMENVKKSKTITQTKNFMEERDLEIKRLTKIVNFNLKFDSF